MIKKRFLIPKVISKDEFTLDVEKYTYEYIAEAKRDKVYLFNKEEMDNIEEEAWNIFLLIKEVKKTHKDTICIIAERDEEENINLIFAKTNIYDNRNISSLKIHASNFKEDVKKFRQLFLLLKNSLDENKPAILFNFNLSEEEKSFILKDIAFKEDNKIEKYLMFLPTKASIEKKYFMVFIAIVASAGIFFAGNFLKNRKNNSLTQQYEQLRKEYKNKIETQNTIIKKLQKKLSSITKYANKKTKIFISDKESK